MEFSHTSSSPMPFLTSFLDSSPQKTSLVKISCKLNKNFRFYNFFSLQGRRDFGRARLFKRRKGPKLQLTVKSWEFELWGWNFGIPPILSSSLSGPNFRKIWAPWFRGWMIYPGMTLQLIPKINCVENINKLYTVKLLSSYWTFWHKEVLV